MRKPSRYGCLVGLSLLGCPGQSTSSNGKPGQERVCFDFDAKGVVERCRFQGYTQEAGPNACVVSLQRGPLEFTKVRLTPFSGMTIEQAVALHEESFLPPLEPTVLEVDAVAYANQFEGRAWAIVGPDGSPVRVAWPIRDCGLTEFAPALASLSGSAQPRAKLPVVADAGTGRALPPTAWGGSTLSLLHAYAERPKTDPAEAAQWLLPFKVKRMAVVLIIAAARDDMTMLDELLTSDARWGLPDRRQLGSRPIDEGTGRTAFFDALRRALNRFPKDTPFTAPRLLPPAQKAVTDGQPYWVTYGEPDSPDRIVLRMRAASDHARIEYVGFHPDAPTEAINVEGEPPEPPPAMPLSYGGKLYHFDANGRTQIKEVPTP